MVHLRWVFRVCGFSMILCSMQFSQLIYLILIAFSNSQSLGNTLSLVPLLANLPGLEAPGWRKLGPETSYCLSHCSLPLLLWVPGNFNARQPKSDSHTDRKFSIISRSAKLTWDSWPATCSLLRSSRWPLAHLCTRS